MQINSSCWEWMAIGIIVASECKYEAIQWLLMRKYVLLAFECQPNILILTLQKLRACWMKQIKSDNVIVGQTWNVMYCSNGELTCSCFNNERIQFWCWVWFVVSEKWGKQESLNHYRIFMNVADQEVLQEQPHNIHKVYFLEMQCNAGMKNCSAL